MKCARSYCMTTAAFQIEMECTLLRYHSASSEVARQNELPLLEHGLSTNWLFESGTKDIK
jgi:hypothetical protein